MKLFLIIYCSLLLLFTILPLIKKQNWIFRICEYPRLQKFVATVFGLIFLGIFYQKDDLVFLVYIILMSLNAGYLLYLILPFTRISKVQVLRLDNPLAENKISLMISNVLQDNTDYAGCLHEINRMNPDVLLLLETNSEWEKQIAVLEETFAYTIKVPLENKYGMLLYSKLPLEHSFVHYMVEADIPSIHTQLILRSGIRVQLYATHPTPPVPNENPSSAERDKELLLIADLVKKSALPVIVMGDLNDVAWSYTTTLFLKMSGLLDPRKGRGFFNTFHAHHWYLRFPLDHAFISVDWKLDKMQRLNNFNSDHFPIFISLQYEENAHLQQESLEPDQDDVAEAEEKKQ
jgi:endonuclease/exonuclease/phosphatase (EEP) superfamily protein YafD